MPKWATGVWTSTDMASSGEKVAASTKPSGESCTGPTSGCHTYRPQRACSCNWRMAAAFSHCRKKEPYKQPWGKRSGSHLNDPPGLLAQLLCFIPHVLVQHLGCTDVSEVHMRERGRILWAWHLELQYLSAVTCELVMLSIAGSILAVRHYRAQATLIICKLLRAPTTDARQELQSRTGTSPFLHLVPSEAM